MENSTFNMTAIFTCTAFGGPDNVYTWTRLSDGDVVANTTVLKFMVENAYDGSIYQCTVKNPAGNISGNVTLNGRQNTSSVTIIMS